jgi:hypothetical protein
MPTVRRAGHSCVVCGDIGRDDVRYTALGLFVVILLSVWYYMVWSPYFTKDDEEQETCLGSMWLHQRLSPVRDRMNKFMIQLVETNAIDYVPAPLPHVAALS